MISAVPSLEGRGYAHPQYTAPGTKSRFGWSTAIASDIAGTMNGYYGLGGLRGLLGEPKLPTGEARKSCDGQTGPPPQTRSAGRRWNAQAVPQKCDAGSARSSASLCCRLCAALKRGCAALEVRQPPSSASQVGGGDEYGQRRAGTGAAAAARRIVEPRGRTSRTEQGGNEVARKRGGAVCPFTFRLLLRPEPPCRHPVCVSDRLLIVHVRGRTVDNLHEGETCGSPTVRPGSSRTRRGSRW